MNAPVSSATLGQLQTAQHAGREAGMPAVRAGFFDLQSFELMQRVAKGFAASTLVPQAYQGNLANCMIALNLAQRINGDPLMVMQNLVIVHGRPTWSAQYLIATANMCGRFSAIRFELFGERNTDTWGCRAWAIEKGTGEKLIGSDITVAIAKKEGWYGKNGSKWQSIPQQMLMYRAGSWWVRAYAPELSMGLMTADEAHDVFDATVGDDGTFSVDMASLQGAEAAPAGIDPATGEITGGGVDTPAADEQAGSAITADQVRERLAKATDVDILDADADLIREISDPEQQAELTALYRERRDVMTGGSAAPAATQQAPAGRRQRGAAPLE